MVGVSGYQYSKTGDLSGDICLNCGALMIIDKNRKRHKDSSGKVVSINRWTVRCQTCGREKDFSSYCYRSSYR